MTVEQYVTRQLERRQADYELLPDTVEAMRRLSGLARLVFVRPELLLTPYRLESVYPFAGQTAAHRVQAAALAAALADTETDSLLRALRQPGAPDPPPANYALQPAAGFNAFALGRVGGAILQQLQAAGGEGVLLVDSDEQRLVAIFDLRRDVLPEARSACLELQASGLELSACDIPPDLLPEVAAVSDLPPADTQTGMVSGTDGRLLVSITGERALQTAGLPELPAALADVQRLMKATRRAFFWRAI